MTKVRLSHGLKQLLSEDPGQLILHAVEQVQPQAHHRRLGRVLRRLRRRYAGVGWIHASDAYESCDRVVGARLLGYQLPREPIGPQTLRIFENGTYMHLRWYNTFLSLPAPFEVDVAVLLRQWPIIGEADVVVKHPSFQQFIIELKSMNHEQFKALKESKPEHREQLNTYLGLDSCNQGLVWYENKNTQEVKIFLEDFQQDHYHTMQQRVAEIATVVLRGVLPKACGVCALDSFIENLDGIEKRMELMHEEREKWLSRSQSS